MKFTENNIFKYKFRGSIILIAAFFIGILLRVGSLSNRPMHVDEAVHASKFGELLENNYYRYDPVEYHGPALNYLTLIPAALSGVKNIGAITESTLRIIPALSGILLLFFFLFLKKELGNNFLLIILLLLSFSSILVFYSRYYIQESLLVSFTFCFIISLFKFLTGRKNVWLILSGFFAGLAFASKETSLLAFGSVFLTFVLLHFLSQKSFAGKIFGIKTILLFIIPFGLVSVLLFTSFFTNARGIFDSLKAVSNYFYKAGNFPEHIYPWHYYFSLIIFKEIDSFTFTEIFILLFSLAGIFFAIKYWNNEEPKNSFIKIILVFTILETVIYSLIPYKTPWTMMTFWTGILIMAAYGINETISHSKKYFRHLFIFIAAVGVVHQELQAYQISFKYQYHPQNPFVYSQATPDVEIIGNRIREITSAAAEKDKTFICVIAGKDDYWPLPWYLRSFKNTGWFDSVPDDVYKYPVIIAKPDLEDKIVDKLFSGPKPGEVNLYIPLFDKYMEIRPGVEIRGYVRKDLYDQYLQGR